MTLAKYLITKDFRDLSDAERKDFLAGWQSATFGGDCKPSGAGFFEQGALEAREHAAKAAEKMQSEPTEPKDP